MLKYIRRQTSRRRSSQDEAVGNNNNVDLGADTCDATAAQKRHSLRSTTSFCDEVFLEQLNTSEEAAAAVTATAAATATAMSSDAVSQCGSLGNGLPNVGADEDIFKYNSRLSMTLAAIVSDPNCLSYFVHFLEARNGLPLIKFYLDIENFKRAALTQLEREQLQKQSVPEEQEGERPDACSADEAINSASEDLEEENDDGEDNDVPELKTLCDLSMRKPLTDDEKSRIYAETNKQISKSNRLKASSELSLCSSTLGEAISAASIKDAIAIYQKYLIVNARLFVELPIGILAHISLLLCGKSCTGDELEKPIPASCFDEARDYVLQQLERDHVHGFLQSSYYCKYCVELIDGAQINIFDVLYSEVALFYFTEYLEQQHERECLEFWITAINFRKSFASSTPVSLDQAQADAMVIYERYFSLQSDCRLWMSDKMRLRVEETICAPGQLAYAFDLALLVTATYLEQKYFADFLKSSTFANYVNELKAKQGGNERPSLTATVQHKLSLRRAPKLSAQQRHRKTLSMSDCTHISQHNTLLAAMDTTKPATNMNIDSRQLNNPQLLWQRPISGALKFGHVNALGRYERDFEAVESQQSWSLSGSKLKNAMRKLVNLPEDHVQEEIAWQVAEMIVRDVTNVTLNGRNPTS
ncbi:A-kinase anchor protein 10, mitochondrial [Scaptodrosophila lebanonensis]|uniref:A-kinase anchor protein 10, mitochondrial n=1 Tax=Drosophila lebanonensis TaxID=7225 RepID=A0A6J2U8P6_DROLE|nr:A-kinase anchor protein 10, mitochondrial [Scaptodrosophila lebanonensis]